MLSVAPITPTNQAAAPAVPAAAVATSLRGVDRPTTVSPVPDGDSSRRAATPEIGVIGVMTLDDDTAVDGHDPRSSYVETFWLPVVGPSTTLLLRHLADELDASPGGFEIDAGQLSSDIGLGTRVHRRSPFVRTLDRAAKFGLAQFDGVVLAVRPRLATLHRRQVQRLSPRLQRLHEAWVVSAPDDGAERRTQMVRATQLARTLLMLGEAPHEVERQLHQWQTHPSIAWHAVQWAQTDEGEHLR